MEQFIYLFTMLLEVIVAVQVAVKINEFNKKVIALNETIIPYKNKIAPAMHNLTAMLLKANRLGAFLVRFKCSKVRKIIFMIIDIISFIFFVKSFKKYKGLGKINFFRKLFSYSLLKSAFKLVKGYI